MTDASTTVAAELVSIRAEERRPQPKSVRCRLRRAVQGGVWALESLWGLASLLVGLSVLATLPVLQLASLGYLLEVVGRIGRTGRWTAGSIGLRPAGQVGLILVAIWLCSLPTRLLMSLHASSMLINAPNATELVGQASKPQGWGLPWITAVVTTIAIWHVGWALYRGGRWRDFAWPAPLQFLHQLRTGFDFRSRWQAAWRLVTSFRLPYYWWLGFKGYLATFVWIVIPAGLLAEGTRREPDAIGLFVLLGILSFAIVATYLPLLQAELGRTGRWQSMFDLRLARQRFGRAPWMWFLAISLLFLAALPLYLLKAEMIATELAWFPGLFFIAFMWPARVVTGWALLISLRRDTACHWVWRWTARLSLFAVAAIFAGITYFTPQVSWYGADSMWEQHAFLVPAPFLQLK